MTAALIGQLQPQPELRLDKATVTSVQAIEKAVTVSYMGADVAHVGYLASYTPVVGDTVFFLMQERIGMVIIGKQDIGTKPPLPTPAAPASFGSTAANTYNQATGLWTGEQIVQSPTKQGAWFYAAPALAALAETALAGFEIQVTPAVGSGPLSFVLHGNDATLAAAFTPLTPATLISVPGGVASWVSLPLAWASSLIDGSASGVGLSSDIYSATVGGGTLRFTPL